MTKGVRQALADFRSRTQEIRSASAGTRCSLIPRRWALPSVLSFEMASNVSIARCMRASSSISRLASSLRDLYLSSTSRPTIATQVPLRLHADVRQGRSLSSSIAPTCALSVVTRPVAGSLVVTALQQQIRGMKVHSSIKKRCEHCKVRLQVVALYWCMIRPDEVMADWCYADRTTEEGQERKWVPICHLQRKSQAQTTSRVISDGGIDPACSTSPGRGGGQTAGHVGSRAPVQLRCHWEQVVWCRDSWMGNSEARTVQYMHQT